MYLCWIFLGEWLVWIQFSPSRPLQCEILNNTLLVKFRSFNLDLLSGLRHDPYFSPPEVLIWQKKICFQNFIQKSWEFGRNPPQWIMFLRFCRMYSQLPKKLCKVKDPLKGTVRRFKTDVFSHRRVKLWDSLQPDDTRMGPDKCVEDPWTIGGHQDGCEFPKAG